MFVSVQKVERDSSGFVHLWAIFILKQIRSHFGNEAKDISYHVTRVRLSVKFQDGDLNAEEDLVK